MHDYATNTTSNKSRVQLLCDWKLEECIIQYQGPIYPECNSPGSLSLVQVHWLGITTVKHTYYPPSSHVQQIKHFHKKKKQQWY